MSNTDGADLLHRQPRSRASPRPSPRPSAPTTRSRCSSPRPSPTSGSRRRATPGRSWTETWTASSAPQDSQLDPNINSTFDLKTLLLNQYGAAVGRHHPLPQAVPGEGVRDHPGVQLQPRWFVQRQLRHSDRRPRRPPDLRRPSGVHREPRKRRPAALGDLLDVKVNFSYRFTKDPVLTGGVEVFNVFNSQRPITSRRPVHHDARGSDRRGQQRAASRRHLGGLRCDRRRRREVRHVRLRSAATATFRKPYGSMPWQPRAGVVLPTRSSRPAWPFRSTSTWGRPTAYQPVRQFRFSLRVTF